MSFTSSNKSAYVYLFKVNNGNTSTMSVTTYFTNTLHIVLVFPLLTLNT